ncbi:MAG: glycoside hydrolase family 3 N-terminal domain-containing protein [Pseudomonadota bacterium]
MLSHLRIGCVLPLYMMLTVSLGLADRAETREPTLSDMAGQIIIMGFIGSEPTQPGVRGLINEAAANRIGGIILFANNVKSPAQLRRLNGAFKRAAPGPFMIAVDQEGGAVQRLTAQKGFVNTPSAADIARKNSVAEAERLYARMAQNIASAGVTANLAPVVDLNVDPANRVIGRVGRSYSTDPAVVARYARAFVRAHRASGVATALKHFPGHGSSAGDTHKGFVDVTDTWSRRELAPFQSLVRSGDADMVMVAHVALQTDGGDRLPSTLSPAVVEGLLRRDIGFDGVAVSDDLEMAAIRREHSRGEAAVRALRAGVDLLVFAAHGSEPAPVAREIHTALVRAAQADPALRSRLRQAYARAVRLKRSRVPASSAPIRAARAVPDRMDSFAPEKPPAFQRSGHFPRADCGAKCPSAPVPRANPAR